MDDETKLETKARPNAGRGRPKGARNKTTLVAKEAIALAAEGLGGVARLIEWAKKNDENERIFWTQIYTKLLPLKVDAEIEAGPKLARALVWQSPR